MYNVNVASFTSENMSQDTYKKSIMILISQLREPDIRYYFSLYNITILLLKFPIKKLGMQ